MSLFSRLRDLLTGATKAENQQFPPRMFCVVCGARNQWTDESHQAYHCTGPVTHRFQLHYNGPPLPPKEKPTGEI